MTFLMANFHSTARAHKSSILFHIASGKVITVKNNVIGLTDISELGHDKECDSYSYNVIRYSLQIGWALAQLLRCAKSGIVHLNIRSEVHIALSQHYMGSCMQDVPAKYVTTIIVGDIKDLDIRKQLVNALQCRGYEEI